MSKEDQGNSFWARIKRGRKFERWERSRWKEEIEAEATTEWKGKRGRLDIRWLDEEEGHVVVVELKATDWDTMADHRIRPNALRHARQTWRYIEAELKEYSVSPALVYPSSPTTPGRKEEVEAILHEQAIQVVWRDDEYLT